MRVYDTATGQQIHREDAMRRTSYLAQDEVVLGTAAEDLQKAIGGPDWGLPIIIGSFVLAIAGTIVIVRRR